MTKIRVMIVEDSHVVREFLRHLIGQDPRLEVVAAVDCAEEALRVLHRVSPDVISMDIRLPGMNGFEATQRIMSEKPTPIVVVSASVEAEDLKISMNALRAGALSVVEKPVGTQHHDYHALASKLCSQLVLMSQVKVIRQHRQRRPRIGSQSPAKASGPLAPLPAGPFKALGIVASTGGPAALQTVLSALDKQFPLPILLVQHIAAGFLDGFASWLASVCPFRVVVTRDGDAPTRGVVHVAAADRHLRLVGNRLRFEDSPPVSSQCPSGTILFRSLAESLGPAALAVLLTGMGDDGAAGLKDIRDAGGYTIAEDESTAVVYGMPAAAVKLRAVCESLPLPEIAPRLHELVSAVKEPC